jgi:hypothetical protein
MSSFLVDLQLAKLNIEYLDFKPQQWDTLELLYNGRDTLTVLIKLFLG